MDGPRCIRERRDSWHFLDGRRNMARLEWILLPALIEAHVLAAAIFRALARLTFPTPAQSLVSALAADLDPLNPRLRTGWRHHQV